MNVVFKLLRDLEIEIETGLQECKDNPATMDVVEFARWFVMLRTLKDRIDEVTKPFNDLYTKTREVDLPAKFDEARVPSVNLDEGYRVTVAHSVRASVKGGQKEAAIAWLTANGLADIVTETINASTLSAVARSMAEENKELDPDIFAVYVQPTTSVTKTSKG